MKLPLQITFRGMDRSEAVESMIRERASRLDEFAPHIMSGRVVVEMASKHHVQGNQYEVRIDLTVTNGEIAVTREPHQRVAYQDIAVAIRDAFDSARRQLEDYVRLQRGFVKSHETTPHGIVRKLFPIEGYGFLESPDGRDVYFHRNSVLHDRYKQLEIGTEVAFVEEEGDKGPQASTVKLVGRHGHH